MRRRSMVGPVILVLIGGLLLANNLRPDLPLFQLLALYWPFLLIGWGVLRLIEVLAYAGRSRTVQPPGLTGGEIALIILICLFGSAMFAAHSHFSRFRFPPFGPRSLDIFGETYDYPMSAEKNVGEAPRIVFEHLRGNIRIETADAPQIRIQGRKTVRAFNKEDADRADQQSPLEILTQGDQVTVRTNQEHISGDRRASADLEVTAPRRASVEATTRTGDFDILNLGGGVNISAQRADVRLNKIGGDIRIEVRSSSLVRASDVKGNIELQGRGQDIELENIQGQVTISGFYTGALELKNLAKRLHFESRQTELLVEKAPGRISMRLGSITATDLIGPIRLTTKARDVKLEDFTQSLDLETETGDVELRPHNLPLPKIDARCRSGNIQLVLPAGAQCELKATTRRGEARNDFGPGVRVETAGHGATLSATLGTGPAINLTTDRGTVAVEKE